MTPRFLLLRGRATAVRLALPAMDRVTIGSASSCDVRVSEPGVAPEHAVLFLDHGVGLKALDPETGRIEPGGRGGAEVERPVAVGETVEVRPGDRLRLGALELAIAEDEDAPRRAHPLGRALFEDRVDARLRGPDADTVLVVRLRAAAEPARFLERASSALPFDVLAGDVGAGELALMPVESSFPAARARVTAVLEALAQAGCEVLVGTAEGREGRATALLELARERLARPVHGSEPSRSLFAADAPMQRLLRLLERVARSQAPVLVVGETGTGKDLVAQLLHERSDRARGPFLRVSAAALPDGALEAGAAGFLSRARGGTLHLDEVGGLPERAQLALGHLLDEPAATHDVRVVASTNQDLAAAVGRGSFRKDLFFRLNPLTLEVPSLAERPGDILDLARHFLAEAASVRGERAPQLTPEAEDALLAHGWPGNVRELRHVMERAVLAAMHGLVEPEDLALVTAPVRVEGDAPARTRPAEPPGVIPRAPSAVAGGVAARAGSSVKRPSLREELAALERQRIVEALERYPTQREAAEALEMPMRTFLNRLDEFGIPRARGGGKKPGEG